MAVSNLLKKTLPALLLVATLFACKNEPDKAAQAAQNSGNPELATLNEQLLANPKNDSLHFRRAQLYYDLEGYQEAAADLVTAIQMDSTKPQYYHLLADVYLDATKSRQAIQVMEVATSKFPNRTPTLLKMSEMYLIVKQHTAALQTLDRILQRDPQNADAFYMTGRVAYDMGEEQRAIVALRKAVQFDATLKDAWVMLGRVYMKTGDKAALQCFDNALRIDSTDNEVRTYKAMYFKTKGDPKRAFAEYRDLIARDPQNSAAFFDIGTLYLDLDSLPQALVNLDLAIRTDPIFVKAYYFRGVVKERMGKQAEAIQDYEQASKMSPNYAEPKTALERLKK